MIAPTTDAIRPIAPANGETGPNEPEADARRRWIQQQQAQYPANGSPASQSGAAGGLCATVEWKHRAAGNLSATAAAAATVPRSNLSFGAVAG